MFKSIFKAKARILFSRVVIGTLFLLSLSVLSASARETKPSHHNSFPKLRYKQFITNLPAEDSSSVRQPLQSVGQWTFPEVFSFGLEEYWCENNVAVADFDQDGLEDIALLATTTHNTQPPYSYTCKVILLQNQDNWQFNNEIIIEYTDSYGYAIKSGDLNNDGWSDLVILESGTTHIMLNNQLGGFSESWNSELGYSISLADINNDSSLDIVSGTQTDDGGKVETFLNNGSGTNFVKTWESELYGDEDGDIDNVLSATLNSDNAPDIVATEIYSGTLVTFAGNGTDTSFTQRDLLTFGDDERAFSLAVGNVNNDTLTDIAVYFGWGRVRVFTAQNTNSILQYWQSPDLGEAADLGMADFDKDGFDDLFVGTFDSGALLVYRNRPGIDFELMWNSALAGEGYTGTVADIDNNGYPDLIVGEQDSDGQSYLRILRNAVSTSSTTTPTITPEVTPTPSGCDGKTTTVETDTGGFELLKRESKVVTVTVTDAGGCPVADKKVSAKVNVAGKKRIKISPSGKTTDENGQVTFIITAMKKTGNARIAFQTDSVKNVLTVRVRR